LQGVGTIDVESRGEGKHDGRSRSEVGRVLGEAGTAPPQEHHAMGSRQVGEARFFQGEAVDLREALNVAGGITSSISHINPGALQIRKFSFSRN